MSSMSRVVLMATVATSPSGHAGGSPSSQAGRDPANRALVVVQTHGVRQGAETVVPISHDARWSLMSRHLARCWASNHVLHFAQSAQPRGSTGFVNGHLRR